MTGASGGGTQTLYLALLDDRIRASAPVVILYPWSAPEGCCLCEGGLPIMRETHTNCIEFSAAVAPRPQLIISVGRDQTRDFPQVCFPLIQQAYLAYSASNRVKNVHLPREDHDYGPSKRAAMYEFFARYLGIAARPEDLAVSPLKGRRRWKSSMSPTLCPPVPSRDMRPSPGPCPVCAVQPVETNGSRFTLNARLCEGRFTGEVGGLLIRGRNTCDESYFAPILFALVSSVFAQDQDRRERRRARRRGRRAAQAIVPKDVKLEGPLYTRSAPIKGGLTEGPAAAPDGSIYFSDIPVGSDKGMIVRYDPATNKTEIFTNDSGKSNGLCFDAKGFLITCEGSDEGVAASPSGM